MAKQDKSLTPSERVCAEQSALKKKIETLDKALKNRDFIAKLSKPELALLKAQLEAMTEYYNCLTALLAIWRDV